MGVSLDQIIPWGRSRAEYELMFDLKPMELREGVLDCGGGPASFTAEVSVSGVRAVAVDPIYAYSGTEIRTRFELAEHTVMDQVLARPEDWVWSYHQNPEHLRSNRRNAVEKFLADYEQGLTEHRYVVGELPRLPFDSNSFGMGLSSHLLFLYSDVLSQEFHVQALLELCRVAREVRIFPLLSLDQKLSPHLEPVCSALKAAGWFSEMVTVNYELQRGGNQMLRVKKIA